MAFQDFLILDQVMVLQLPDPALALVIVLDSKYRRTHGVAKIFLQPAQKCNHQEQQYRN